MKLPAIVAALFLTTLSVKAWVPITPDETVLPEITDPEISTYNFPQAVYYPYPEVTPRGELFLFLTGTHGHTPVCLRICKNAALLGYHVIQVIYPDDTPASICQRNPDPDAFGDFRWAIIHGGMANTTQIPKSESIENRAGKLIDYLAKEHPDQNWGQFLNNGEIAWEKVAVGGVSQGGGHAALIATRHLVARVLCFAAPKDYSTSLNEPPRWYDRSVTPANRFFAFNNVHDKQGCDYKQEIEILKTLGVIQSDNDMADVDNEAPPYHNAHALFTSWPGPDSSIESIPAHVSVCSDTLPGKEGLPLFRPVWLYMLTAPTN